MVSQDGAAVGGFTFGAKVALAAAVRDTDDRVGGVACIEMVDFDTWENVRIKDVAGRVEVPVLLVTSSASKQMLGQASLDAF